MWHNSPNEREKLEHALDSARRTILSLLPDPVQDRLRSYYELHTWQDFHLWEHEIIEHFVENAFVLPETVDSFLGPRAYCPLCGSSSSGLYDQGFSLPEGLRRHLRGWGNIRQCDVLEHVFAMVLDSRRERFVEFAAKEDAEKKAILESRRAQEPLFDLGSAVGVRLIDEQLGFGMEPRDSNSLELAVERLKTLGFEVIETGHTRKFIMISGEYTVYADPRSAGRIKMFVYPPPPARPRRAAHNISYQTFEMHDSWKNDLKGKFAVRLAEATEGLTSKPKVRRVAR
jgi:hypothetical protein